MLIRKPSDIPSSLITSKDQYLNRRRFLREALSGAAVAGAAALGIDRVADLISPRTRALAGTKLQTVKSPLSTTGEQLTSYQDITTYNNFYEFGVDKGAPSKNAGGLPTRPWTVRVEGLVNKPKTFDIDTLLKMQPLEDRVYTEGLRMDEAMHPLALLTFGLYGEVLPNQDGAPVRIVVPWKYGFKSAKSIVAVRFTDKQPPTTWNEQGPNEYGFYSNVNPNVDHPRWSQKTERRIGQPFYEQRKQTLMFNGYADQVASLYNGMDLKKNY